MLKKTSARRHTRNSIHSRRTRQRKFSGLESLEPRQLLAVDLMVQDGFLQVVGNEEDDQLTFSAEQRGEASILVVNANGREVYRADSREVLAVQVDTGPGDDSVQLATSLPVAIDINLGEGNDRFENLGTTELKPEQLPKGFGYALKIDGGGGNDRLAVGPVAEIDRAQHAAAAEQIGQLASRLADTLLKTTESLRERAGELGRRMASLDQSLQERFLKPARELAAQVTGADDPRLEEIDKLLSSARAEVEQLQNDARSIGAERTAANTDWQNTLGAVTDQLRSIRVPEVGVDPVDPRDPDPVDPIDPADPLDPRDEGDVGNPIDNDDVGDLPRGAVNAALPAFSFGACSTFYVPLVLIIGGGGDNTIFGTAGNDLILALGGNDTIFAGPGNDYILAGSGNDTVYAGTGDDRVLGQQGDDRIYGGRGRDCLIGGTDDDLIDGNQGDDEIRGNAGDDCLHGDEGDDLMRGGSGVDLMLGFAGDDRMYGGRGDDIMVGYEGNDWMRGGRGADAMAGFGDDDVMHGDLGDDYMIGGDGDDRMFGHFGLDQMFGDAGDDLLRGMVGDDLMEGGSDNDRMFGGFGFDSMSGNEGDDVMFGGFNTDVMGGFEDDDVLFGGSGTDYLLGHTGEDCLAGQQGDDVLYANEGRDILHGGLGADTMFGGEDEDEMSGGAGQDFINGQAADDILDGGAGDDTLLGDLGIDTGYGGPGTDTSTTETWFPNGSTTIAGCGAILATLAPPVTFPTGAAEFLMAFDGENPELVNFAGLSGAFGGDEYQTSNGLRFENVAAASVNAEGDPSSIEDLDGYDGSYRPDGNAVLLKQANHVDPLTMVFDQPIAKIGSFLATGAEGAIDTVLIEAFDVDGQMVESLRVQVAPHADPSNRESFWTLDVGVNEIASIVLTNDNPTNFGNALMLDDVTFSRIDAADDSPEFEWMESPFDANGLDLFDEAAAVYEDFWVGRESEAVIHFALPPADYAARGVRFENLQGPGLQFEGDPAGVQNLDGYDGPYRPNGDRVLVSQPNHVQPLTILFDQPVSTVGSFVATGKEGVLNQLEIELYDADGNQLSAHLTQVHTFVDSDNREGFWAVDTESPIISKVTIRNENETNFGNALIIDTLRYSPAIEAVDPDDVNVDGTVDLLDLDLLCTDVANGTRPASHASGFLDRQMIPIGDSNFDHAFDTGDLVAVFQAGKYETGQPAKWSEGDWNCDGLFNTQDLIAAFQAGTFESGAATAQRAANNFRDAVNDDIARDTLLGSDVDWRLSGIAQDAVRDADWKQAAI